MTNEQPDLGGNESGVATIQFGVDGLDFSAIRIDLTENADYLEWVMRCITATIEARNKVLGGHMINEARAVVAEAGLPDPSMPAAAYQNPQGERVNPRPAPSTTPVRQGPVAAPVQAQRGIPEGSVVPGEVHAACGNGAVYKAPFTSKAGKQISGTLNCPVCKNKDGFPQLVRWLKGDDPAWTVINA